VEGHVTLPAGAGVQAPLLRLGIVSDETLARFVAGEACEDAFAAIYKRYHQRLYRYCRSIVRNESDAQDALQSAFAGAFAALKRGQRDAPLRPWLFRIAHNEAVSVIRRRHLEDDLSEALEPSGSTVEEAAEERQRLALLLADLHELPERQRNALVLRELSGLSHQEISVVLGSSVGAAKQTIFEARRALSEFTEGRAMACEEIRRTISDADGRTLRGRRVRAHLRDCPACAGFAAAIPARAADLRALAPPLPAAGAAGLLGGIVGTGSGHGGGGAGGLAVGAAGKTLGASLATKALAGAAIVATVAVGTAATVRHFTPAAPGTHALPLVRPASDPAAKAALPGALRERGSAQMGNTVGAGSKTRASGMPNGRKTRSASASGGAHRGAPVQPGAQAAGGRASSGLVPGRPSRPGGGRSSSSSTGAGSAKPPGTTGSASPKAGKPKGRPSTGRPTTPGRSGVSDPGAGAGSTPGNSPTTRPRRLHPL
jgi:RNA polymerase sigma factor (sigma-70 family)